MFKPVPTGDRIRYSYARINEVLKMPHLIDLQRKSYEWFIKEGLQEILKDISPIKDFTENLELHFSKFTLGDPKFDVETCKDRDATYAAPLNVDVRLIYKDTGEIKESNVFMGDFPLMTDTGTFVINGAERVIVSQLVRSPGVYYDKIMDVMGKYMYGTTVIPNRGAWIEYETDLNDIIYARVDRTRKLPATALLRIMGLPTNEDIIALYGEHPFLIATLAKDPTKNREDALIEIYKKLRPGEPANLENAEQLITNTFSDNRRYDLANVGRYKVNKKMGWRQRLMGKELMEPICETTADGKKGKVILRAGTIIDDEAIDKIEQSGVYSKPGYAYAYVKFMDKPEKVIFTTDISDKIRTITPDDVLASFGYLLNVIDGMGEKDDIDHLGNRRVRCVGELLQNQFRIGLARMERVIKERMTIQDAEIITPQALINIRPVVAAIKEFFGSSQLSQFMDQNNPLAELTHKRRLSALGPGGLSRERAGYEVRDVHHSHYGRMCPIETPEGPNIGLIGALCTFSRINDYGFIETPYRVVDEGVVTDEIRYMTADEEDAFRVAQANEKTEDHRFTRSHVTVREREEIKNVPIASVDFMDVSPKQTVSIATALIPFLENDDGARALMGANMQRQAVPLIDTEAPIVGTGMEYKAAIDSGAVVLAKHDGVVERVTGHDIVVKTATSRDHYNLLKFERSNQGTCINQKARCYVGQKVKAGDVLADGPSTDRGELALGRNVVVAFVPWEGYNYEDAILLSEDLVKDDIFTSIHIEEYEAQARDTKLGPEEITRDIPNVGEDSLKNLDDRGIVRIGAEVKPGDILVGKVTPKGETELTAEERLLRAIFGEKAREVRDTSLRVPHGEGGIVVDVRVFTREDGDELSPGVNRLVRCYVAQKRKISEGDKMAGRHGNKGVISRIMPVEDMPFLPDGTPVQIVLNPLGVPSRMNIGQVLETHLGMAANLLDMHVATPVFDGASENEVMDMMERAGMRRDGKTTLYDGRTGQPFDNPVTVGIIYMVKLSHLVDDKIHARSTGPYSLVTQQPLGGKAQFGGQRFGEMEVWALEAYGAAYTLQEILTVKSDDVVGRVKTYEAIVKGENIPEPGVPESFRVLIKELQSLALDVRVLGENEQEIEIKEEEEDISEMAKELGIDIQGRGVSTSITRTPQVGGRGKSEEIEDEVEEDDEVGEENVAPKRSSGPAIANDGNFDDDQDDDLDLDDDLDDDLDEDFALDDLNDLSDDDDDDI